MRWGRPCKTIWQPFRTAYGVRTAFHTIGTGPAVVLLFPYHVNHLALDWQVPLHRGVVEYFARYFTVVNLDLHGAGLSERSIDGLSLDTFAADLDAVPAMPDLDQVAYDKLWLLAAVSSTEGLHITERCRRPDFGHLEVQITIDDSMAFTKTWNYTVNAVLHPDDELIENICPENERDAAHIAPRSVSGSRIRFAERPGPEARIRIGDHSVRPMYRASTANVTKEPATLPR